jgi:hypothetical protein
VEYVSEVEVAETGENHHCGVNDLGITRNKYQHVEKRTIPTTERARRKEQALSHLLGELSPMSDTTIVPSATELQGRFPGLGKVWASAVHEKLRYAKRSGRAFMSRWQMRLFRGKSRRERLGRV